MNTAKLQRLQALSKACKTVYAVYVKCDGEDEIDAVWETKSAAEMARDDHNNVRRSFYPRGRARVVPMQIRTDEIARLLFAKEERSTT